MDYLPSSSPLCNGLFALPYLHPQTAAFSDLTPAPGTSSHLEHDYEYLQYLRVPSIHSTAVPFRLRPALACLDSFPHKPLDNKIHPLFKFERWQDLTREQHNSILPALRIATRLMEQHSLLPFWKRIMFGTLAPNPLGNGHYLKRNEYENTLEADAEMHQILTEELPRLLKFSFGKLDIFGVNIDAYTFGNEERYQEFCKGNKPSRYFASFNNPRILLHSHFLYDIEYLSAHGSGDDLKNVYLRTAIALCHELAHIVWKYRHNGDFIKPPNPNDPDAYPEDDPIVQMAECRRELGFSWEYYAFGGDIWTIDHPGYFKTYYKPQSLEMKDVFGRVTRKKNHLRFASTRIVVPRWWINMWFRESTWEHFKYLYALEELRLPSALESGYVFHKNKLEEDSAWTLCAHGIPRVSNCRMPTSAAFIIWNTIKPRQQAAQEEIFESSTWPFGRSIGTAKESRRRSEPPTSPPWYFARGAPRAGRKRAATI